MLFYRIKSIYGLISMICIIMQSCVSTKLAEAVNAHFYKYSFAIREHTSRKGSNTYSNGNFTFIFNPEFIRVSYDVTNNSDKPIQVHWENTYLVVHNDSSKIIPSTIELRYADEIPQPVEIAPGQTLQGFVTPVDYIKNSNNGWVATEFYPSHDDSFAVNTDWIMGLIGVDIFKLYIPVSVDGQTNIYKFTFYPNEIEKSVVSPVPKNQ